jgi:hypothetical protein
MRTVDTVLTTAEVATMGPAMRLGTSCSEEGEEADDEEDEVELLEPCSDIRSLLRDGDDECEEAGEDAERSCTKVLSKSLISLTSVAMLSSFSFKPATSFAC